ncbi:MAG: hypothetical protein K2W82_03150 [Candidatus Obscuribacterales bacterium]|nr:hypothetical protein [Candidatus Obscuribacterales bacterium]
MKASCLVRCFLPCLLVLLLNQAVFCFETESLGAKVYAGADWVFQNAQDVRYEHLHRPAKDQVHYFANGGCAVRSDCSGFVSYVLHEVAPKHYHAVHEEQGQRCYPQAKAYARFFAGLSTEKPDKGWLKVGAVQDLKRGDLIAWEKGEALSDHGGHGNSGHVMIVAEAPGPICQENIDGSSIRYVSVYVIDDSSVYHFPPEELPPGARQAHRNGLGKGCVRIILDSAGKPIGYWEGTYWGEGKKELRRPTASSMIHCARLVPFNE